MNCEYTEREHIHLVERLWDIECRHLLGGLSEPEYRRALAAIRRALPAARPEQLELAMEVECE